MIEVQPTGHVATSYIKEYNLISDMTSESNISINSGVVKADSNQFTSHEHPLRLKKINGITYVFLEGRWVNKYNFSKRKKCPDCVKIISNLSKRCPLCANIKKKGKHPSPDTEIKKGQHISPNTEFKKGMSPWHIGLTKATDERIKQSGKKSSKTKKRLFQNKQYKEEYLKKNKSCFKKGIIPWSKGLTKKNNDSLKKISEKNKGRKPWSDGLTKETHPSIMNQSLKIQGENNPIFNNWSSREPYGITFSPEFKETIRQRDKHICMLCNKSQKELNRRLDVHHIDYNKDNTFFDNCISLCKICHSRTNGKRKYWIKYLQKLIKEKYGGNLNGS